MRQRNLLVLLVVAFVAFATVAAKGSSLQTASKHEALDGGIARRFLKSEDDSDPATEERGFKLPSFGSIKSIFSTKTNVGAGMKNSPEIATAFKNPKVNEVFTEVAKKPGIFTRILSKIPVLNTFASRLRGKRVQFTSRQVTNVGHLAVTSSSSGTFARMWVKYGAAFLFVVGIVFLATVVYKGVTP
ncbi:hypothetical protein F443_10697 [Phytophthora nicotianae P1569]|uniref:RxLR effector protein n=3 Tax=Phytophthora nicotianae TaxID=4792 RepID=V9F0K4_PHYNI|nr:hypothetical protein F443_10697 [Phytophthora nicotianae P1569]